MSVLAKGHYRYWRDAAVQAVSEPWQLSQIAQGLRLQGQRLVEGRLVLEVEADYAGSVCTDLKLRWHTPDRIREVDYRLRDAQLDWSRADGGREPSLRLPAGSHLFPLLRAATGPLLRQLADASRTVVVPCIRDPAHAEFLQPLLSERRALAGEGSHYRYFGGEYGEQGCDCWLDECGLLQRYRWASPHGEWEVRLEKRETARNFSGFV